MTVLAVAHAVHYGLVIGGAAMLGALLLSSRPASVRKSPAGTRAWRSARADVDAHLARLERQALAELQSEPVEWRPSGRGAALGLAVVATLGSALVHAAAFPAHLRESALLGAFFCGCTLLQLAWAAWAVGRPATSARVLGAIGSLGLVALWLWTRRVGVPFLAPRSPEPVGSWDTTATVLELVAATACLRPWTSSDPRSAFGRPARALAVVTGVVLTGLALTGAPS